MKAEPKDWRVVCNLAKAEKDTQRRRELCEQARQLIHARSLQIADAQSGHPPELEEENDMNQALRDLWILENRPS